MNYEILWIDATLRENVSEEKLNKGKWTENGVKYTLNNDEGEGGWIDYEASYTFTAKDNDEARDFARDYNFNNRDVEVWCLMNERNQSIMTEEDL